VQQSFWHELIAQQESRPSKSIFTHPLQTFMYLVAIAWMYVVVMMTVAEASAPNGTVLGAIITFVFYGLLPVAILMYLMGTPMRRKARKAKEAEELAQQNAAASLDPDTFSVSGVQPDTGREAPADAIAPVRKEV
jgi:uncharacterized membrane protein